MGIRIDMVYSQIFSIFNKQQLFHFGKKSLLVLYKLILSGLYTKI